MPPPLVLASSSAYRRTLLDRLCIPYSAVSPSTDETPRPGESAEATALRLAEEKARAVAAMHPDAVVIGSDQVAVSAGSRLDKPGSHEIALRQLMAVRGRSAVFHTAVCVLEASNGRLQRENVPTTVYFREFTTAQAERYLRQEEPYDCAGSAKIEGLGIALVGRVESTDPTALIGLPLIALTTMLQRAGMPVL